MFELTEKFKLRFVMGMRFILLGVFVYALYLRALNIAINAVFSLSITFLPAMIERNFKVPSDPGITFLITVSVISHAAGFLGFYENVWWWDVVLHTFSSFVVAAVGYVIVKSVDNYYEEIHIPPKFMFFFILIFTMAMGVLWEIFEFSASMTAKKVLEGPLLIQRGLNDTLEDLVADMIGGIVFAIWGTGSVQGYVERIKHRII